MHKVRKVKKAKSFRKAAAFLDFRTYKKNANEVTKAGNHSSDEKFKYV